MSLTEKYTLSYYEMITVLEDLAIVHSESRRRSYGLEDKYSPMEIHTVSLIADHPGITTTEIARHWVKTTGAISQTIKRLEAKGLVDKDSKESDNSRRLYVTEKGSELDKIHHDYDRRNIICFLDELEKNHSAEEINTMFSVLQDFMEILRKAYQN